MTTTSLTREIRLKRCARIGKREKIVLTAAWRLRRGADSATRDSTVKRQQNEHLKEA